MKSSTMLGFQKFWRTLSRKKVEDDDSHNVQFPRVMGFFDLLALGLGATLGVGVYVTAGEIARNDAGPATCVAFFIAAIAACFSGVCYAEFASRVPKAGSAYVYSYVTIGEFAALIIGWNLILEYLMGAAITARGLSGYVDIMAKNKISSYLNETMPIKILGDEEQTFPDFLAFGLIIVVTSIVSSGVKESSMVTNVFTTINLITIAIIIVVSAMYAKIDNWFLPSEAEQSTGQKPGAGEGGFLPFGWKGLFKGALTCFYSYVGFDSIASTGEEAKNPHRNIPYALILTIMLVFVVYLCISIGLTLVIPFYEQDVNAPFPHLFKTIGLDPIYYIVSVGAICAMSTALIGVIFPMPRVLQAMGNDGVIFRCFGKVNEKTKTPVLAAIISGLVSGIFSLLFPMKPLINLSNIATLTAYSIVAISIVILRYKPATATTHVHLQEVSNKDKVNFLTLLFNWSGSTSPSKFSGNVATWGILLFGVLSCFVGLLIRWAVNLSDVSEAFICINVAVGIIVAVMLFIVFIIHRQPVQEAKLAFKVWLVPILPCCSIFINISLIMQLDINHWFMYFAWMIAGFAIYFIYGIKSSSAAPKEDIPMNDLGR